MAEPVTGEDDYGSNRQIALVNDATPLSYSFSDFNYSPISHFPLRFSVPDGWTVLQVPRSNGLRIDKYYIEPETGRKFRSLNEVMRYFNDEEYQTSGSRPLRRHYGNESCGGQKKNISGGKYYYEPGTGQKFRSLSSVKKQLAEENLPLSVVLEHLKENNLPLSKAFKLSTSIKNHGSYDSWKKSMSKTYQASSLNNLPCKIKWVMASSRGDSWNAFVDDSLIPDSQQQQWHKSFMFAINYRNYNLPFSG